MKVEADTLGSPSLISLVVSMDVKHHVYLLWRGWAQLNQYLEFGVHYEEGLGLKSGGNRLAFL